MVNLDVLLNTNKIIQYKTHGEHYLNLYRKFNINVVQGCKASGKTEFLKSQSKFKGCKFLYFSEYSNGMLITHFSRIFDILDMIEKEEDKGFLNYILIDDVLTGNVESILSRFMEFPYIQFYISTHNKKHFDEMMKILSI